ncbi:WD repeat and coiled-coil-containing protein-like isoform X2 [Accipiter gentilis]|uniref:WD repeat and coiled-coil-containing protein-like isoform X2 n=1 Tax=Astur gentilis TaxID=8957 RepID=UPI002110CFD4|nr:WD repeat and coiled-coil-containing protein-like isoform X2 [Accipiter gentilis]
MELGKAKLLRTGLNALYQAIHPVHGIAWTDGKQVILTALYYHNGELKFGDSSVVGQFEHVHGLYWGPCCSTDTPALLAVQHKKHVSVWQLGYSTAERNKPLISQTCEVGPVDLTHILANHRRSDPGPLITLKRKDSAATNGQDSSHMILVTFERKVTTTRKVTIPGILVPDIMAFDLRAQIVAVASNTSNIVLVYSVTSSCMPHIQQIQLEKNERPKGLCFLTAKLLLILIGKQKFPEPSLIPSSSSDRYVMRLMIKELMLEEDPSALPETKQNMFYNFESSVNIPGKRKFFENLATDDQPQSRELLIPRSTVIQSPSGRRRLIEEVKSPSYEQSSSSSVSDLDEKRLPGDPSVALETLDAEPTNRSVSLLGFGTSTRLSGRPTSPKVQFNVIQETSNSPKNNNLPSERGMSHISRNLERLCGSFNELQLSLSEITDFAKNGRRISLAYPCSQEPPVVHITYQKSFSNGAVTEETKDVLLCDGKIHLNLVQQLFDLPVIEMKHGSSWIVLTADKDGFVPLIFRATQEIIIRDGSDSSEVCGGHSYKKSISMQPPSRVT